MTLSTEDREYFKSNVRRMLERQWGLPAHAQSEPIEMTRLLASLGLTDLGYEGGCGGLNELVVAMEELGRCACPVPLHAAFMLQRVMPAVLMVGDASHWLADLRNGDARLAVCIVPSSGEAAKLHIEEGVARGTLHHVEGVVGATHAAVFRFDTHEVALVPLGDERVRATPVEALGRPAFHRLECDGVLCTARFELDGFAEDDALSVLRAALCARALGAIKRNFELVVEYAKDRRQFGKQIGAFQAIQHKLATCLISISGVERLLEFAAKLGAQGDPTWAFYASCAFAHAADVMPRVALEIQHTFGAIGYAEEHEAPRHFRRVHLDMLEAGGIRAARAAVAQAVIRNGGLPDRPLGDDAAAFRDEVRTWLAANWGPEELAAQRQRPYAVRERHADFARRVGEQGWAALTWPAEFGGLARPVKHQLVMVEEMERAGAPRFGAPIQAAGFMAYGTPEQKAEHLARIRAGDGIYGLGYSEPGAGSDLASVRTAAVPDGDHWVINGQKIWTSTYWGGHMWVLARTDPQATPQHAGLTLFVLSMDTPGVRVVPNEAMYGGTFANVFYDDVRVSASAVVGGVNGAWRVITLALAVERAVIGGSILSRIVRSFDELVGVAKDAVDVDVSATQMIGTQATRLVVGQVLAEHSAEAMDKGGNGAVEAAICKVFCSELMESFFEESLQWGGVRWALSEGADEAIADGRFEHGLRHSLMWTIGGGTGEVQRNLIAQKGLGLPRA